MALGRGQGLGCDDGQVGLTTSGLLPLGLQDEPRPWPVYEVSVRSGKWDVEPFLFLVETGEPRMLTVETLPEAEIWNGDLQKVDVTDPTSLVAFCGKYGLPASSACAASARLEWFRHRFDAGVPSFEALDARDPAAARRTVVSWDGSHTAWLDQPEALYETLRPDQRDYRPQLLSEVARALVADDRAVVGAVSLAEAAETVRSLQMACVLPMAYRYFAANGGANDLVGYLGKRRYLSQRGPDYFLFVDQPIVRGSRLDTFERAMRANAQLPDAVRAAEERGLDVRAGYDVALARGLHAVANGALRFLAESNAAYRRTDYSWEWGIPADRCADAPAKLLDLLVSPFNADGRLDLASVGSLGEGIIYQFARVYADPLPWRRCENCGRVFKKYREERFVRNIRETRFCRRSCNVSFNQRSRC